MNVTPLDVARRFVGLKEGPDAVSNPAILAMLRLDAKWVEDDDVAWCSAFVNAICWLLGLARSRSLAARSWLLIGEHVELKDAQAGYDIVIFKRGSSPQPGPEVLRAPGHVAFYTGQTGQKVFVLGGNQADAVSIAGFPASDVLGVRRIHS